MEHAGPSDAPKRLFHFSREISPILVCLALGLVVALVFLPVLGNGFVQWDDDITIYRNPHVQGLDLPRLHWMFTDASYSMRYKPLSWLSLAVIHAISGLKPFSYHLLGLFFHCANTALVFLVFRKLMRMKGRAEIGSTALLSISAALGALLWALHPLRVEAVARVTDMTYCQSLFFVLISLLCYLRAVPTDKVGMTWGKWYWSSVAAFGLAMFTYPFVFAYPAVLLVLDYYLLRRSGLEKAWWRHSNARRIWLEKVAVSPALGCSPAHIPWAPECHWNLGTPESAWSVRLVRSRYAGFLCLDLLCLETLGAFQSVPGLHDACMV